MGPGKKCAAGQNAGQADKNERVADAGEIVLQDAAANVIHGQRNDDCQQNSCSLAYEKVGKLA
ncbi:MAG: hypothetical protein L0228_12720 [Planctomycetes bacterium]|nr:hypothetical protein [Planctomycetota bacterium]